MVYCTLIGQVVGESKESEPWPTISRNTCAVVYKTLLFTVVNQAKKVISDLIKLFLRIFIKDYVIQVVFNPRSDQDSQFNKWERLVGLFNRSVRLHTRVHSFSDCHLAGSRRV